MSTSTPRVRPTPPPAPAILRLVQLAVLGRWRATGEQLYREVVRVAEIGRSQEVLVSGCGDGVTAEWLARRTGAAVTGVDADGARIEHTPRRGRRDAMPICRCPTARRRSTICRMRPRSSMSRSASQLLAPRRTPRP